MVEPVVWIDSLESLVCDGRANMAIQYGSFENVGASVLPANLAMRAGQYLSSESGVYRLRLQGDGNLVLLEDNNPIWTADSQQPNSKTIHRRKLRDPLRFVVSNSGFLSDPLRNRIWIATTAESLDKSYWYNNYLRLTDEGNIVIFDQRNGSVRWARLGFVPGRLPIPRLVGHIYHEASIPLYDWKFNEL